MRLTDLQVPACRARPAILSLLLCFDHVLAALDNLDAGTAVEWIDRARCPVGELRSLYYDFSDACGPDGHDSAPDDAAVPATWAQPLERLIVAAGAPGLDASGIHPEWRATFRHFAARLVQECGGAALDAAPRVASPAADDKLAALAKAMASSPNAIWKELAQIAGYPSGEAARKAWFRHVGPNG